jgi:2-amino-4-hydroxy-6-hydroxymethyldihydropteridine diphosphokinase
MCDLCSDQSFILLSLGSNLGDRIANLKNAVSLLTSSGTISGISLSSFYESEPYGYREQPWFVNLALSAYCKSSPYDLLALCKEIEIKIGRQKRDKWHEREIDIDIILFDDLIVDNIDLKIPHPAMQDRKFVLLPSSELVGESIHPRLGVSVNKLLVDCTDKSIIRIIE